MMSQMMRINHVGTVSLILSDQYAHLLLQRGNLKFCFPFFISESCDSFRARFNSGLLILTNMNLLINYLVNKNL